MADFGSEEENSSDESMVSGIGMVDLEGAGLHR